VVVGVAVTDVPVVALRPADGLQLYADPPVALRLVELPLQIVVGPDVIDTPPPVPTVMVCNKVLEQPDDTDMPVIVYVVVTVGVAVTVAPVVAESEAPGAHE
jgi:hypothetical protein